LTGPPPTDFPPGPALPGSPASPRGETGRDEGLLSGLSGVLRGLSAVFWGLPLALLAFARHFLGFWTTGYDLVLPPAAAGLLLFGLFRMSRFQRQERIWQRALLTAQMFALLVTGLAPFLYLWSRMPGIDLFSRAVLVLVGASLAFLVALTRALARLAAMLPDDTARADAALFHGLSTYVVAVLGAVGVTLYLRLHPIPLSDFLSIPRQPLGAGRQALLLLLVLVPVAMAMAVTWKLKEVVLAVVTGRHR
jgi:hypothetical protein